LSALELLRRESATKSLHPSPMPPAGSQLRPAALPTRRLLVPWVISCIETSASRSPSRSIVGPVKRNICMRPEVPSGGVAKFALLVPEPSCASARTRSPPSPIPVKLVCWKLPEASSKPSL